MVGSAARPKTPGLGRALQRDVQTQQQLFERAHIVEIDVKVARRVDRPMVGIFQLNGQRETAGAIESWSGSAAD